MPQLKQPSSLQNMSMNNLCTWLANRCDNLCAEDSLNRLREFIDAIKENIGPFVPCQLSAKFHKEFLHKFEDLQEPRTCYHSVIHRKVVLEVIMDRKIIGLICEGSVVAALNPEDANRLQGLRVLDLSSYWHGPLSLDNFQSQDLTTFIFREYCTNDNLKTIGRNCPKLVSIDVSESMNVTNEGLRSLNPCSQLRVVIISYCRVSHKGITEFLAAHEKIETIFAWANSSDNGFDCFSHSDSNVYPSMNSFTIVSDDISNEYLNTLVLKFPNLTSLGISGDILTDIYSIKSFNKLTKLNFGLIDGFTWDDLNSLLRFIGVNITELRTSYWLSGRQRDLNNLFQFCGNIEHFNFNYRAERDREILVIPPFKKLKVLECSGPGKYCAYKSGLEFGQMLELENLIINRFYMTEEALKSMILDEINFPKLKELRISHNTSGFNGVHSIEEIAKINNLDFEITQF